MPAVVEPMSSGPMDSTAPSSSSDNKKRNKLGYHRTSVACGRSFFFFSPIHASIFTDNVVHCRRRKIRCLVAANDAQGRCENCIRLRKECQFFPVDQQPPVEKKPRPQSRLESASTDPSTASSSPPIISSLEQKQPPPPPPQAQAPPPPPPQTEPFLSYQPIPFTASQDMSRLSSAGFFAGNPMPFTQGECQSRRLRKNTNKIDTIPEFPPSLDPSVPWDEFTTISDPQMLACMNAAKSPAMMNLNPNVFHPDPTSVPPLPSNAPLPATPTVPSQTTQALNTTTNPAPTTTSPTFAMQPDGSVWQVPPPPPSRSMTFPVQQPDMTAYPGGPFAPTMDADPKRGVASPSAQSFPGTPVNPQSPSPADTMQTMPMSMSYPGQQPATSMGYPVWPDASGLAPMNVVSYPMFSDASQQGTPFGSPPPPPMGHSPG